MNFGLLLALPFLGIPLGIISLFTPFGMLFALPGAILIIGASAAKKYHKIKTALLLLITAVLGQWLSFFSWIASHRAIRTEEITRQWGLNLPSIAKAGFPFSSLELPPRPMGSDQVPIDLWGGVFTNHLFWFLIAFVLATLISRKNLRSDKKYLFILAFLAVLALIFNLGLFSLWYD